MIKINSQGYISEIGERSNNEDNCGLIKGATYVVCDGMGGAENGEVASDIVTRCFMEAYKANPHANANQVLSTAEAKLTEYINQHSEANGMGTTLTLSQIKDGGIYLGWCGDSRIYQFRHGEIIFQTTDHSWVNEALKSGIISQEEAVNHPKSNIITRAVQGSHKPTSIETMFLSDIRQGDLFMHCTDGVLETWSNDDLKALFSSENEPDKILEIIKRECALQSKDNFTAIVYKVGEALFPEKVKETSDQKSVTDAIPNEAVQFVKPVNQKETSGSGSINILKTKVLGIPLIVFLVAILPFVIFLIFFSISSKNPQSEPDLVMHPAKEKMEQSIPVAPPQTDTVTVHPNN
ncbi:MAG TPA: hypothetical protein DHV48_20540 [Prolixibacteraceae bacterium]|nr:hypothetical protein [Prolixibacteraceae bacterium]